MLPKLPPTFEHSDPIHTLAPFLVPYLPYSFPLLRRIQSTDSPPAHILSTLHPSGHLPSGSPALFSAAWVHHTRGPETQCWIFSSYEAIVPQPGHDLVGPQLNEHAQDARQQLLALFRAVADLDLPIAPAPAPPNGSSSKLDIAPHQLIVGSVPLPLITLLAGREDGRLPVSKVLKRDFHARQSSDIVHDSGGPGPASWNNVLCGISVPYVKYLIPPPPPPLPAPPTTAAFPFVATSTEQAISEDQSIPSATPPTHPDQIPPQLPAGYTFDMIRYPELSLVVAATEIPRQIATLAKYGSIGVRYRAAPSHGTTDEGESSSISISDQEIPAPLIGWAFLGTDGSLSSLHVEPAHRGQGLAKAICLHLFALLREDSRRMGFAALPSGDGGGGEVVGSDEGVGTGWQGEIRRCGAEGWVSADVAEDNEESRGVCRAVGGREAWTVRWIALDLQAVVETTEQLR